MDARVVPVGVSGEDGGKEFSSPWMLGMHAAEHRDSVGANVYAWVQVLAMAACLEDDGVGGGARSWSKGSGDGVLEGA